MLDSVSGPYPAVVAAWLAALLLISLQSPQLAMLVVIGMVGAFTAGLVGLGGAILLIPMRMERGVPLSRRRGQCDRMLFLNADG
jgi:hypothetical protein